MRLPRLPVLLLFIVAVAPPAGASQPLPASAQQPEPTAAPIPVAQIAEYVERTDNVVRAIRARLAADDLITAIEQSLPATATQIEQLDRDSVAQLAVGLTPQGLEDLQRQWLPIKDQLAGWTQTIGARTETVEQDVTGLAELDDAWVATEAGARENGFPSALREPIRAARASIHETQASLRAQRDTLLALLGRISTLQAQVSDTLAQLDLAERQMRRGLFTTDAPPLWNAPRSLSGAASMAAAVRAGLSRNRTVLRVFIQQESRPIILHCVLLLVILAITLTLSQSKRQPTADDDVSQAVHAVLTRPVSAALILTLLLGPVIHRYAPIVVASLAAVVGIGPLMRLYRGPAAPWLRRGLLLLALLLLTSTLRRFLPPFAAITRWVLLAQGIGGMLSIVAIMHPARLLRLELTDAWQRWLGVAMWGMLALLALSVVANLAGNVTLAMLLTDGVLGAATAALAFFTASFILEALSIQIIRSQSAQRLRSVASHARPLRRRVVRIIRVLMVLAWVSVTLRLFGLLTPSMEAISDVLAASLKIGAVSFSVADILTVVLTVWVSFFIARIVRVVLQEDALPRLSLPRGVPAAISVGVNYVILLIGCVFALSAAGVDPGRVALVAGALGVGIGFGLQNVVNNFVSGIILLFERPIQIGDIISLGAVNGQVRRIGFRSSTIATFDGAEVVVPNGFLVSEQVVNWTLSNYQRRVEVKVGVAYGNDPTAVIAVLEGAAKGIAELLEHPAPRAVFTGFGERSLDFTLWVWTDHQDTFATVRSHVAIAVYEALRTAGIEIPFPQQSTESVARKTPASDADGR